MIIDSLFRDKFVPQIGHEYERERDSISERIQKNHEKYEQENLFTLTEEENALLDDESKATNDPDIMNRDSVPKKTQNLLVSF